jgi:hypothetical protein
MRSWFSAPRVFASLALIALLVATGAFALDTKSMCSGPQNCYGESFKGCTAQDKAPREGVDYDAEYCAPFLELRDRGLNIHSAVALQMFSYLGREHRVIYEAKGVLPVTQSMILYLFDNMPFTAEMVNAYRGTEYVITYDKPDKSAFSGNNGGNLEGSFNWVLRDSAGHHPGLSNVFWGVGRTKLLAWRLKGTAIALLDLAPVGADSVSYRLRAIVSPSGAVLNAIMHMDIFKSVVSSKIGEIVENIQKAASAFASGDHEPAQKFAPLQKEPYKTQLKEFETIVGGTQYP